MYSKIALASSMRVFQRRRLSTSTWSLAQNDSATALMLLLNRPGVSGDSVPWKGWGYVRSYVEEVPGRAA